MKNSSPFCSAALLVALLFTAACSTPVPPAAAPKPEVPALWRIEGLEQAVLVEVNRVRQARGLSVLRSTPALNQAARQHAQELAERRVLDHTSTNPQRRTIGMRVTAAGVGWRQVAENLAYTSGHPDVVAEQTSDLWMNSPGHRTNMLDTAYTHTGVGVASDRRGIWYVTQIYVQPSGAR